MADENPKDPATGGAANPSRRGALRTLVGCGCAAYAAAVAVPVVRFAVAPAEGGAAAGARWLRVGRLADLPEGEPRRVQVVGDERDAFTVTRDQRLGSIWLERHGDGVRAFSATCPHLGCAIDLAPDKKGFACPCHASRFSQTGDVESGPSPRAMDPLDVRLVDGFVEVDFKKFRQGIADREEVRA